MQVDRRRLESALTSKGFVLNDDGDHRWFHHQVNGRETGIATFTSRGSNYKVYGDSLLKQIKLQLKLGTTREVYDLLTCQMSEEKYLEILRSKGCIPR